MLGAGILGGILLLLVIVGGFISLLWYFAGLVATLCVCFVFVCIFMMLVILIQKPRGGGLSGAFGGGGGSSQAAFGSKTGDVLTYVTIGLFVAFLGLAMGLTWTIHPTAAEPPPTVTPVQAPETPGTPGTPGVPETPAAEKPGTLQMLPVTTQPGASQSVTTRPTTTQPAEKP